MKISVITVVYNDLVGLKKTVKSVLDQTTDDYEYIIIDGDSTDGTKEYLDELHTVSKKISEPDEGIYNAMNKAVQIADGEFCIFMNAGDIFHDEQVIERANKTLGYADLYVGNTVEVGKDKQQNFLAPFQMTIEHLITTSIYHQSTFIRTTLLKAHPYREDLHIVSDWAFFFEQWLKGAKYKPLDFFVSYYFLGGYSAQNAGKIEKERNEVLNSLIPIRLRSFIKSKAYIQQRGSKIEHKIRKSMKKSPLQRDISLIRYGSKYFCKDLISSINKKHTTVERGNYAVKVLYDSQAFDMQTHGGVSRCFTELYVHRPQDICAEIPIIETNNTYLNNIGYPNIGYTFDNFMYNGHDIFKKICYKITYNFKYGFYSKWDCRPQLNKYETIKLLQKGNFDVFHPTFFDPYFLPYLGRKPFVLTVHDMITELYPQYYPSNEQQLNNKRILIPLASHIIAVSENTKRDIINFFNIPEERISVVYHGVDSTPYASTPNSNKYGKYILYVGERHWYKNFINFVRYVAPIMKHHKEIRVVCTGKPFSHEEEILLDFIGMKERFIQIYVQSNQEFLDLYHNAITFVYPSEYEGFGIPILEAFKADCPVMLNKSSCFPEIAGDAVTYFTMTNEASDFEEQFEKIYNLNTKDKETLLRKQRQQLSKYTWNKSAQQLADVYKRLC